jgi:alkylation response protein AidB-like acyl-CoA dehydrogenase
MDMTVTQTPIQGSQTPLIAKDDLESLRESVAKVLARESDSRAVHTFIDGQSDLDRTLWARAAEQGWLAASLPEDWGGLGLGAQGLHVLHYEFGRRVAPGPFIATSSVAQWLAEVGADEQRGHILPAIASGELTAAIPAAFDVAPFELLGSSVRGEMAVLGSEDAGLIVVPVKSAGAAAWALLAPGAGLSLQRRNLWDLTRQVCTLTCDGAAVLAILPDPDGALGSRLKSYVSIAIAADSLGAATNISHQTTEYLKTRVQFDKPIASFQAIKHRVADMVISIATQQRVLDQAVECVASASPDAEMWAGLAKAGATECFAFVAGDCIQLHGGVGHTWEFDPHIFTKRSRLNEVLASDNRSMLDFTAKALAEASKAGRVTTQLSI